LRRTTGEKLELIRLVEGSDLSVRQTLRERRLNRSTFYAWYRRYTQRGRAELEPQPGAGRRVWNRIPPRMRQRVVDAALADLGLIRSRGHFPKGGYDVHDGTLNEIETTASAVYGGVQGGCRAAGARQRDPGRRLRRATTDDSRATRTHQTADIGTTQARESMHTAQDGEPAGRLSYETGGPVWIDLTTYRQDV